MFVENKGDKGQTTDRGNLQSNDRKGNISVVSLIHSDGNRQNYRLGGRRGRVTGHGRVYS